MQIKKGPFGYYAIEKLNDPGSICRYAEEVIAGNKSDFYLKPAAEQLGNGVLCCFEFSEYVQITDSAFSVFSSKRTPSSRKKETKRLRLRRKAAGDLFYSFIKLMDNLISPSNVVLDPAMVFTDTEGVSIKVCCLPLKSSPDNLCLSSIDASAFEKLLNCSFFKSIITDDERNTLVYSIKENNEDLFLKSAERIKNTTAEESVAPSANEAPNSFRNGLSRTEKDLIFTVITSVSSVAALFLKLYLPSLQLFLLSVFMLMGILRSKRKKEEKRRNMSNHEISKQRSSILFSDPYPSDKSTGLFNGNDDCPGNGTDKENVQRFTPLITGKLSLINDSCGARDLYSIYLNETYIGSDCFLSDIVINDPGISPVHAIIRLDNGAFYLIPSKGTGKTYIEDSPLENGKSYEIKSGQKITIGDTEFRFSTESMVKAEF